jgi:hypothetical protein
MAAASVVAHKPYFGVTDHCVRYASTPPHEEGTNSPKKSSRKTSNDACVSVSLWFVTNMD